MLPTRLRVLAVTAVAFSGGVLVASGLDWTQGSNATTVLQAAPSRQEVRPVAELSEAFIAISEAVTPSVVAIETERAARRGDAGSAIPDEIREMYPWFRVPEGGGNGGRRPPMQGSGSGFILTADGNIVTNNHVVEGADKITVVFSDNRQLTARVVGRDPTTDVAVIKVDATGLPTVRIGSSEATRIGEWVLAIGNPLDLGTTVTSGIVSAKGRPLGNIIARNGGGNWSIEDFIQTDAPINPGNSGGPLVNLRGEVVGVNSAIASPTGFYSGYGFAVPIDLARKVADDLIRYGRVRRPALGITLKDVSPEDAEVFRLDRITGVVVQDYAPTGESPARAAGIRQGDVIIAVDGAQVERTGQLQRIIATHRPGDEVVLGVVRYGDRRDVRVHLGEAPAAPAATERASRDDDADKTEASTSRLGVQVQPLTAQLAQEYRLRTTSGVVITDVDPAGPAFRRGIPRGVRIVLVDGQPVNDVATFRRLLGAKRSGQVVSLVLEYAQGQQGIENVRLP
jgi:serine protease Do